MRKILVILFLVVSSSLFGQTTINIPTDYTTIQAGLNAANEGDTVLVAPGTYYENIFWPETNGIKLIGQDTSNTIIDGGGISGVINMNPQTAIIDTSTLIQGLKITNGGAVEKGAGLFISNSHPKLNQLLVTNNLYIYSGGGIYLINSHPILSNIVISNNSAEWGGGGVYLNSSSPFLSNVIVCKNNAFWQGGGIYIEGNSKPLFFNVNIFGNSARSGGGVWVSSSVREELRGLSIFNNSAIYNGGGIFLDNYYASAKIKHFTIRNNYAGENGDGIYVNRAVNYEIDSCNISNNGYGIYSNDNSNFVTAKNNWLGHTSGPYHSTQNPSGLGDSVNIFVNVTPWLTEPDINAPPIPAQNLEVISTSNSNIDLRWSRSKMSDIASYKVYYNTNSGYPYSNSIDAGSDTTFTLNNLNTSTKYYIAVTTVDTDGNESWYSEEVEAITRVLEVRNLDIGGSEDIEHLITQTPQITFNYYDGQGEAQTGYEVNVSTDSLFVNTDMWNSGLVASASTTVEYGGQSLTDGSTYFLRVRVETNGFYSNWSDLKFRMNTVPISPQIINPTNGDILLVQNPLISFLKTLDAEGDSVKYNIQVSEDIDFTNAISSISNLFTTADTVKWNASGLSDNQSYFVRVNSYDGFESSMYSDTVNFYVNFDNDAPNIFSLISPNKDGSIAQLKPIFIWNHATDIDPDDTVKYTLVIDTQEPGGLTFDLGSDTSYTLTTDLQDNSDYYWKVVATDLAGTTRENEGGYWKFNVNSSNNPPNPFKLITPTPMSVETTINPYFYWENNGDIDLRDTLEYELVIYNYEYPNQGHKYLLNENEITVTVPLTDNSFFVWRVIAIDLVGATTVSDSSIFVVNTIMEPPYDLFPIYPGNNESELIDSLQFVWSKAKDNDPLDYSEYIITVSKDSTFAYDKIELYEETGIDTTYQLLGELDEGYTYYWYVEAYDQGGLFRKSKTNSFVIGTLLSVVNEIIPEAFVLEQNYPNPFNPTTMIQYGIPELSNVKIEIFNMLGQSVGVLVDSDKSAGYYETTWNAENLPSGIYLISIGAEGLSSKKSFVQVKKALLLK